MSTTTVGGTAVAVSTEEAHARVSWSAIFAGVVLTVAIELLLGMLGAGIGLGFVRPNTAGTPDAGSIGVGTGLWWLLSTILALVAGGYGAARLAGVPTRFDGILHGLVVWGLALLLTVYLLTSAVGSLVGGTFSVAGGAASAAGSALSGAASTAGGGLKSALPQLQQATGLSPDVVQQQAREILQASPPQDPARMSQEDATKAIGQALPDLVAGGARTDQAKQRITDIVAAQLKISPDEARQRVDAAQARFNDAKNQAVQAGKQAAETGAATASRGSFLAFVGFLVGAIAAAVGGALASPQRLTGLRFR